MLLAILSFVCAVARAQEEGPGIDVIHYKIDA